MGQAIIWVERFNVHGSRLKSHRKLRFPFDYLAISHWLKVAEGPNRGACYVSPNG